MISAQLFNFFKDEITYSKQKQNIKIDKGLELYLTKLMLDRISEVNDTQAYLTDIYLKCTHAKNSTEALIEFRRLGDISLFNAGYFYENLFSKSKNLNYYIDMGQTGYQVAGEISKDKIYFLLRDDYVKCLCILNFIVENKRRHSRKDLERLYQFYTETYSPGNKIFLAGLQMMTQEINE